MEDIESSFQVKLISAVRVPAQHEKLIKAKVCKNSIDMKLALFEINNNFAKDSGITMDEAIVKPSNENTITLVLRNNGFHPVSVEEGRVLGILQEAILLRLEDDMPWMDEKNPTFVQALHASKETSSSGERNQALLDTLHWKTDTLAENDSAKLSKVDIRISRCVCPE